MIAALAVSITAKNGGTLTFLSSIIHIVQQLRKHGISGGRLIFCLKSDFFGLNIDEVFGKVFLSPAL